MTLNPCLCLAICFLWTLSVSLSWTSDEEREEIDSPGRFLPLGLLDSQDRSFTPSPLPLTQEKLSESPFPDPLPLPNAQIRDIPWRTWVSERSLGRHSFRNATKVPLYAEISYTVSTGWKSYTMPGNVLLAAGGRARQTLTLTDLFKDDTPLWSFEGQIPSITTLFLPRHHALFSYLVPSAQDIGPCIYGAIQLGGAWFFLQASDRINVRIKKPSQKSRTRKVSVATFAHRLKKHPNAKIKVTQIKRQDWVFYSTQEG